MLDILMELPILYDNFKSFEKDAVVNVEVGMKHAFLSGVSGFENGREDIQYINIYSKRQNINSISITDTNKSKRDIWQSFIYNGYNKDKKVHVYLLRFQLPVNQNSVSIISNSYIVIDIKSHTYYAHLQVFNSPNFLIKRVTEKNEQVLIKNELENIPNLVNKLKQEAIKYNNDIKNEAATNNYVSKRYMQIFNDYVRQAQNMGLKNANQKDMYFLYRYVNQTTIIPKNQVYNFKVVNNELVFCHDNGAERVFDINNNSSEIKLRVYLELGANNVDSMWKIDYDASKPLQIITTKLYKYTYINGKKYYITEKKHEHSFKPDYFINSDNYLTALQTVRDLLPNEYVVYNNQLLGWVYKQ